LENQDGIIKFLESLFPKFISAAQEVYEEWEQDGDGYSEEYGSGGICDVIASRMADVFNESCGDEFGEWFATTYYKESECHTDILVVNSYMEEVLEVGLPPYHYESGGGYTWRKLPNVTLSKDMLTIVDISWAYNEMFDEDGQMREL
jgi:hypothetical protein